MSTTCMNWTVVQLESEEFTCPVIPGQRIETGWRIQLQKLSPLAELLRDKLTSLHVERNPRVGKWSPRQYLTWAAIEQKLLEGALCIPTLFTDSETDTRLPKITVRFQTIHEKLMPRCIASGSGAMISALGRIGLGLVSQELIVPYTRQETKRAV